jgi:hypothetical protein
LGNLLWGLGAALKVLLCILVFYRRLYCRLPFFALYAVLLVAEVTGLWWAYHQWGYASRVAWYTYWSALAFVVSARGLAVAELCWASLRNYPAVWSLVRKMLSFIVVAVLTYAGLTAFANRSPMAAFLFTADTGLELSIAVTLVALLGFGVRYKAGLDPVERSIALGIALYSTFGIVDGTFINQRMTRYFHWWASAPVMVFDIAIVIWIVALRKALPTPQPAPALISEQVAVRLLRQLLDQMREASDELKRIGRSIWK